MAEPARHPILLAATLLGLLVPSCGDGGRTAAQLVLTPDPTVAPLGVLLKQVRRIDVIVDARDGLLGVSLPGPLAGGGTAVDWDGDGVLEVRFEGPSPGSELPVLEIGVGANAGRDLAFRIFGFSSTGETALDRATGEGGASVVVAAGEVRRVGAPFNLTPRARPPRVLMALPADGATLPSLASVTAVLSTTVKAETLAGHVELLDPEGKTVPVTTTVETATVAGTAFGKEERSVLSVLVPSLLLRGSYELRIGPGIESSTGQRFDQDPATDAEESFVSHLESQGAPGGGGEPCDACPAGYLCEKDPLRCVPVLRCSAGCPQGLVCDPAQAQCVEDCRRYGLCFDPSAACDAQIGLCRR